MPTTNCWPCAGAEKKGNKAAFGRFFARCGGNCLFLFWNQILFLLLQNK
jgi:hypothetical protein